MSLFLVVAAWGLPLVGIARSQSGGFQLDDLGRMEIKFYEGIPTKGDAPPRGYGQSPSLKAESAVFYNDSNNYCTVGWGHLVPGRRPCTANEKSGSGITFAYAETQLTADIQRTGLKPLDACIKVPLTAGQVRALVAFLYQQGPNRAINRTKSVDRKGKKEVTILPCEGKIALALNAGHYDQVPGLIRKFQGGNRAEEEIYDYTDGQDGSPRPSKWIVRAAINPTGAVGMVTVNGLVCASTEPSVRQASRCGYFPINAQVTIKATTNDRRWHFVRWESLDTARDVCAGQGATCTARVRDQLVRAIAVFARNPTQPDCSRDNQSDPPTPGCVRVTVRVIPAPLPSDPGNESIGVGVGSATLEPGGKTIPCLNPEDAPCVRTADVPANTTASVSAQPGSLSEDPSSPPDSAFWKFAGACAGSGTCTFTPTNGATVDVYFIPAMVTLTLQTSGDEGHANMTANEDKGGGLEPAGPVYCGYTYPANPLPCKVMVRVEKFAQVEANTAGDPTIALDGFSSNCTPEAPGSSFCEIRMTSDQTVTAMFASDGVGGL